MQFLLCAAGLFIVVRISIVRVTPNLLSLEVENIRNAATRQGNEGQQRARPLVAQTTIHLDREQHHARAPDRPQESLGCQRRGRLVLVRVDEVVVAGIVEEDEPEADGEPTHCRAPPAQPRIRCPGEDEEADRDQPARPHHRDEAGFCGRLAVGVPGTDLQVVLVDSWGARGAEDDADHDRDEHEACAAGAPALAFLVDDWVGDEEHVEQTVQHRHV